MTIFLIAIIADQLFQLIPKGVEVRLEPIIAMIIGVAVLYVILVLLSWAEKKG